MIQFIGRLHVALLHLPIGFLVLLALLELLARRPSFKHIAQSCRAILVFTVPLTIFTAICGWVLSWSGGYDDRLLFWHKWLGTGVAVATVILFFVNLRGSKNAYRGFLFATLALLVIASHFGGSLTHGSGFYTAPFKKKTARAHKPSSTANSASNDFKTQNVYAAVIHPLFEAYCISCHGAEKSKGDLRLDTYEDMLKGGEAGSPIAQGKAAESLLVQRMALPLDDEDHMPPEAKKQPSPEEIALLEWWINAGAPADKSIADLNPPENILSTIQSKVAIAH